MRRPQSSCGAGSGCGTSITALGTSRLTSILSRWSCGWIPNEFTVTIHVAPRGAYLHGRHIHGKRPRIIELRVDDHLTCFIDVAPSVADADGSEPVGEVVRGIELRVNRDLTVVIDEADPAADRHHREPVGKDP